MRFFEYVLVALLGSAGAAVPGVTQGDASMRTLTADIVTQPSGTTEGVLAQRKSAVPPVSIEGKPIKRRVKDKAAQKSTVPTVSIEGTYDNLTVGKSGDVEGLRVFLLPAGSTIHAIVQELKVLGADSALGISEGAVTVKGTDINFSSVLVDSLWSDKFSGKVSAAGLSLKRGGQTFFLKRTRCG
jgi:hypothetical protein